MSIGLLQDIILKIRRLTGSGNSFQLTDGQIIDFINSYYLYDMPAELRTLKLEDVYTFNTIQGIDVYPFNFDGWETVKGPAYLNKEQITFFQDVKSFYDYINNLQTNETFDTGDGTTGAASGGITDATQANPCNIESVSHGLVTGAKVTINGVGGMTELNGNTYTITVVDDDNFTLNVNSTAFGAYTSGGTWTTDAYSGTLNSVPIRRSYYNNPITDTQTAPTSVQSPSTYPPSFGDQNMSRVQNILITANTASSTLNVTDDGAGNLIGDCTSGTINYLTGAISNLNFTSAIPSGNNIEINYIPSTFQQPWFILFHQDQFVLGSVPDKGYQIEIQGVRKPSQALLGSGTSTDLSGRPEKIGWWEVIAYGASKKIYQERMDMEGVQLMDAFLQEQISVAKTDTYAQLGSRQITTIFRDETNQLNIRD